MQFRRSVPVWLSLALGGLLFAGAALGATSQLALSAASTTSFIDLDVTYISRAPTYYRYCVTYPDDTPELCAGTEGEKRWPGPGEPVTFTAHIANKETAASGPFSFTWSIDGVAVSTGTLASLAGRSATSTALSWSWPHLVDGERLLGDHTVRFSADPWDTIDEAYENNNDREDRTDALSLAIFFDEQLYEEMDGIVNGIGTASSEDWIQWQVAQMNERFAQAVYPTSPDGILSRVRIDHIQVCADLSACMEAHDERAQDGRWQFANTPGYVNRFATEIDWGLIHELAHQVGLIDLYQMDVADWMNQAPDESGDPLWLTIGWPHGGLMGGGSTEPHLDSTYFSSHSAAGLNSNHGYRRGYYGDYLFDVPLTTTLVILDNAGLPVPGADVALFQKTQAEGIPSTPVIEGRTNAEGQFTLPNRPAQGHTTTRTGHTLRDTPFGRLHVVGMTGIFLGRVRARGHEEFFRYDITQANTAHASEMTHTHTITLTTHVPAAGAPSPPAALVPTTIEDSGVTLEWTGSPSSTVVGYNLYRAERPDWLFKRILTATTGLAYTETFPHEYQYRYVVTAVDGSDHESAYSQIARVPHLVRPWGVAIDPEGDRVVAENHHGRLLLQRSDGRFVGFFNREVYFAGQGLDISPMGDILVAEPGRHCVHHFDDQGTHLGTIGECAESPGQLDSPADVTFGATNSSKHGLPLEVDEHTLMLCRFDETTSCATGETGTAVDLSFGEGRFGQGVVVTGAATLTYPTSGNVITSQGTIEFWVRPSWDGDDHQDYAFFETSGGWLNRIRVAKDGANNLRFLAWDGDHEYSLAYSVAAWQSGDWHHVAAVWSGDQMWLLVDGQVVDERASLAPNTLGGNLYLGSSKGASQQANATIDELRISDAPRYISDAFAFIADTGQHQVRAIGKGYQDLAEFGQYGAGPGEFSSPKGIVWMGDGRLLVADSGNGRLQLLSYAGGTFTVTRIITAGLKEPGDVAVDRFGRIIVADTGDDLVKLLDVDGNLLAEFGEPDPPYYGPFDNPRGVAVDALNQIVVADTGNCRIVQVTLHEAFLPLVLRP